MSTPHYGVTVPALSSFRGNRLFLTAIAEHIFKLWKRDGRREGEMYFHQEYRKTALMRKIKFLFRALGPINPCDLEADRFSRQHALHRSFKSPRKMFVPPR